MDKPIKEVFSVNTKKKTTLITVWILAAILLITPVWAITLEKSGDPDIWFSVTDFTALCGDVESPLAGIVVTSLPESGSLVYGGRALMAGEAVPAPTLGALSYRSVPNGERTVTFNFIPVFEDGSVAKTITASLTVQSVDNKPPSAQDIDVKTYKNVPVTGTFQAEDPEGDALTYRVTTKPRRGEIEVGSDGRFIYTPFRNKTGSDTVSYVAVDAYGNVSPDAKINVKIEKPDTKTTYADMEGHPAQYAAIRLSGEGIFTGQMMSGNYYFRPDEPVSRAEMIAMVVRTIGLETEPVTMTGFYDDAEIPAWFKPYAQTALKAGIISGGRSPDGRAVMNAGEFITLNQAATVINNALRPVNVPLEAEAVTVWSAQAIANLDAAGMFDEIAVSGGDRLLTRGEVAILLVRAMDAYETSQPKNGLLSWVFGW